MNEQAPQTTQERHAARWASLKTERSSWDSHWKEISTHLLPRSGRFLVSDTNKGDKRHNNILDSTGSEALDVLAAGMMAGMTSPARPWFRLATPDADLNKSPAVKLWLSQCTRLMLDVFAKSNTYRALHTAYTELGSFGTASNIMMPDFKTVIHSYPLTTGEFCIAQNWKGEPDTLYREFQKPVGNLVSEFGIENVSMLARQLWNKNQLDAKITVIHAIEPRQDRDSRKRDGLNMPWSSVYFEPSEKTKVLRESGYKQFPALAARWATAGGDVYGHSPGMNALGDIKQLQHQQLRKAQAIDFKSNPPLQVPSSLKNRDIDRLPGGITYVDQTSTNSAVRSMFEVNLDLNHMLADIQDVRTRIRAAFKADLFLMLANSTNTTMTATEVAERHEEKLLMLGPVVERLHSELLDPLIEITFSQMVEAGIVPPPPPELEGMDLKVEFVSMLAQAQRAIATNGIDRYVGNLGQVASFKPDVLDKFNADEWADGYGDMLGVDPQFIVSNDKVALIRADRAKAAQAQQQAAMAEQMAGAAQKLGTVQTDTGNAGNDIMKQFSGYT